MYKICYIVAQVDHSRFICHLQVVSHGTIACIFSFNLNIKKKNSFVDLRIFTVGEREKIGCEVIFPEMK